MGSPNSNHWQRSVQLNGDPDNQPLKDVVICCTAVPEDQRVSQPDASLSIDLLFAAWILLTVANHSRKALQTGLSKWEACIDTT